MVGKKRSPTRLKTRLRERGREDNELYGNHYRRGSWLMRSMSPAEITARSVDTTALSRGLHCGARGGCTETIFFLIVDHRQIIGKCINASEYGAKRELSLDVALCSKVLQ